MSDELIRVAFDPRPVTELFGQVTRRMAGKPALMREVSQIMFDEVEENFAQQGRPRWAELKYVSLKRAALGNQILQASGRLAGSITAFYDAGQAGVGTNLVYAAIHQFGGKTKAHVIRAKNARALATPYGPFKQVNHPGSVIPARPFLSISPAGEAAIVRAGENFLRGVIGA